MFLGCDLSFVKFVLKIVDLFFKFFRFKIDLWYWTYEIIVNISFL